MRLPGFLTRNLRVKALATGVALVTWVGVVYASNPPESRTVAVHVPQDPASLPGKFLLATPIADVQVRLSGTREHVSAFTTNSLRLSVDYHAITSTGVQQVPLHVVNNDSTVSLDQVASSVTADVDVRDSVNVPVSIVIDATPPTGYVAPAAQQSVTPNVVAVVGPQRELSGLTAQVHINLANQKTNLEGDYKAVLYDRFGRKINNLEVPNPNVTVTITVSSVTTSRSSAVVPRVSGALPAGRYLSGISSVPLTVVLNGPQDLLNGLDSISTLAIPLNGLSTGDHVVQVKLAPPAGVTATPDAVSVTLTVAVLPTPSPSPSPTPSSSPAPTATPTPTPVAPVSPTP
ncbi:MAG TPA: CdaR family protein [Candidatus Dormibacteraeota bacterium]|jgi:YbbR domain-containing protein|nr:CdaR family protein [Candidatus Dormibacteraeota bacterium]